MVKKTTQRVTQNIVIENARLIFRNFSGSRNGRFNPTGQKSFCVLLETDVANKLIEDGWNVRWLEPREEGDEKTPFLQVALSFENFPPKIVKITKNTQAYLDVETVKELDGAELENVDLIIRPYNWEVNGKHGVKAYLKSLYATVIEDELAAKYAHLLGDKEDPVPPWEEDDIS